MSQHQVKNYEYLIGSIEGLSEKQLRAHFGLYEGYVKKINEVEEKLKSVDRSSANYSYGEFSELQRRKAVPYNGAVLHELYFENLTGDRKKAQPTQELKREIERCFGSFENWWTDAKGGILSGYGWVLLTRSRREGLLRNDMVEEHHRGVLVEQDIILAIDGWEHAYMIDYGTKKADYLKTIEKALDWEIAQQRFDSVKLFSEEAA